MESHRSERQGINYGKTQEFTRYNPCGNPCDGYSPWINGGCDGFRDRSDSKGLQKSPEKGE